MNVALLVAYINVKRSFQTYYLYMMVVIHEEVMMKLSPIPKHFARDYDFLSESYTEMFDSLSHDLWI